MSDIFKANVTVTVHNDRHSSEDHTPVNQFVDRLIEGARKKNIPLENAEDVIRVFARQSGKPIMEPLVRDVIVEIIDFLSDVDKEFNLLSVD